MGNEKVDLNPAIGGANLSPGRVKLVMAAITFCMFVMGFSMFKLLPMQTPIMSYFNIEVSAYGYLNTASSWVTVIFTIPVGFMIRKMSSKWCMFLWFVLLLGGSLLQVVTTNYILFVIGRMVEGAGAGFLALLGHSLTANLVPCNRIGFWASFMVTVGMLGQVILTNASTWLMSGLGFDFQFVFILLIILELICLAVWLIMVPASVRVTRRQQHQAHPGADHAGLQEPQQLAGVCGPNLLQHRHRLLQRLRDRVHGSARYPRR